ncbi:MAG: DUF1614 domain-containing protein [Candidatus Methanodesulfokora sp.]|jgi:uncharacterized membrane protein
MSIVHAPHRGTFYALLVAIIAVISALLFFGFVGAVLRRLGLSSELVVSIVLLSIAGSLINIPLMRIKSLVPIVSIKEISIFGVIFRVPSCDVREMTTTVAVNVGGAIVPLFVSAYLLYKYPSVIPIVIAGIVFESSIVYQVARPVPGVGIVTPMIVPPTFAALVGILLGGVEAPIVAYCSGTIGTLIGADLMNLGKVNRIGAGVVSIGGAGTFDGIFLSRIVAVLLS